MLNSDYKDMLSSLLKNRVKFLLVDAYAMATYGCIRATGDLDIWVEASIKNSERIAKALSEFGALSNIYDVKTFSKEGIILQIGVEPCRIDIITGIDGVNFKEAYKQRKKVEIDGIKINIISKKDLITNKLSTGRDKDRLDAKRLQKK